MTKKYITESFLSCIEILIDAEIITKSKGVHLRNGVKKEDENTYKKITSYLNQLAKKGKKHNEE